MAKLTINVDNCKGCGLCVDVCPKTFWNFRQIKSIKKGISPLRRLGKKVV